MTCGLLLLDKPLGLSSNAALQRVRRVFGRERAGHTGALDPLASGMLPICLGEATKIAGELLDGDKAYEFTLHLGERRSTGDREGEVIETAPVPADLAGRLREALPRFLGESLQVPPMYSALKHQGEPLYRLARRGESIERPARRITLHALELLGVDGDEARFTVRCSKGTYIRVLGEDLAAAVGSCGHLAALRRTGVAPFFELPMVTLEALQESPDPAALLLGADAALPHLPAIAVSAAELGRLKHGQRVPGGWPDPPGRVRVYGPGEAFRGVGELLPGGVLHPRRLFNDLEPTAA